MQEYGGEDGGGIAQGGPGGAQCLSTSYNSTSSPGLTPGQHSPNSSSHYDSHHSPFGEMGVGGGLPVQEFHAEFITHPVDYNQGQGRASPPPVSPDQSPSPSSGPPLSPNNTLPSFMDTYTPSVVTIEQRSFGAEADYENRMRQQQQQQKHSQQQQQMTVKFHLKTELPDSFVPHARQPHQHYQYEYQPPHQHQDNNHSDVFYLKKEPSHAYSSATPSSSPAPQPEFVDWLHSPANPQQATNLTTLTNYIPFPPDYNTHSESISGNSQGGTPVRRTILSTPQPM